MTVLLALMSCQQNKPNDTQISESVDGQALNLNDDLKGKFKFGHVETFTPGAFKNDSLVLIDSLFHNQIISQIEGFGFPYSDNSKNYFISKQNDISGLSALTISLYWGVCYDGITLLILDKQSKLMNSIPLTEWYSSCDYTTNTETTFTSDNTFTQRKKIMEHGGDTDLVTELEFKGLINASGQVDTLDVLTNRKYED